MKTLFVSELFLGWRAETVGLQSRQRGSNEVKELSWKGRSGFTVEKEEHKGGAALQNGQTHVKVWCRRKILAQIDQIMGYVYFPNIETVLFA